jgi:hypothetical protein
VLRYAIAIGTERTNKIAGKVVREGEAGKDTIRDVKKRNDITVIFDVSCTGIDMAPVSITRQ